MVPFFFRARSARGAGIKGDHHMGAAKLLDIRLIARARPPLSSQQVCIFCFTNRTLGALTGRYSNASCLKMIMNRLARRCLARCRRAAAPRAKRAARLLPPQNIIFNDILLNVKMGRNVRQEPTIPVSASPYLTCWPLVRFSHIESS